MYNGEMPMKAILKRTLLLLTSMLLLVGCASGGTEPAQTDAQTTADTEAVTESVPSYPPVTPPTEEQITGHEHLLLWPEDNIPYYLENDEKGLMPTIRAYLCEGARSAVVIFPGGGYFQLSDVSEGVDIAQAYNNAGYSAFVVNYR